MMQKRIAVAPMMDWTDRHDRYFLRLVAPHVFLYTEMVTANAIVHGDLKRLLDFHVLEHPVGLQLGGCEIEKLVHAAKLGEEWGYDEINLNVGCPSDRVKKGRFGACLMLEPELVAECVSAMQQAVRIPVTVKCRIGVDEQDSFESLCYFIKTIYQAGCQTFIVHARKAWLNGLSPKENREIPPLRYEVVQKVKEIFPQLTVILNGGIKTLAEIDAHLVWADGVMIGREAYSNPYFLAEIEQYYFSTPECIKSREEVLMQFIPYIEDQLAKNVRLSSISRHILGLFQGEKGARIWRRYISENAHLNRAEVVLDALKEMKGTLKTME